MRYNNRDLLECGNKMIGIKGFGGYTIRQYQEAALEILKEVDRICIKNNITYFFMYGSLIVAVRHHGFIPWDDDVDIILTHENYNRLRDACKSQLSDEYDFINYDEENGSGYTFSRIRKKSTTYIIRSEISKHGRNAGFYIDVMTLHYLSENPVYCFIQKRSLLALHRLVSPGFAQGREHLTGMEDLLLIILRFLLGKKRLLCLAEKILGSVKEEKSSKMISNCLLQERMELPVYDKIHFSSSEYVPFEDFYLPVPYMAITLLNHSYCKGKRLKGMLLEHKYENEYEAILKGDYFYHNDIMYIPAERERDSHLEVFFDSENGSSFYDEYYFSYFDKRKNDRYAVKERHYKEKAAKYLAVMNANEGIAKSCCCELQLRKFLQEILQNQKEIEKMELEELVKVCNAATDLKVMSQEHLSEKEMLFVVWALLKCGYLFGAKRLLMKTAVLYTDDEMAWKTKLKDKIEEHLSAYYAIFEGKFEYIREFANKYTKEEYLLTEHIGGVLAFEEGDYKSAEIIFSRIARLDENQFLAQYYLGMVEWKSHKNRAAAKERLLNAMDTTNYMPFLHMAISRIEELEGRRKYNGD